MTTHTLDSLAPDAPSSLSVLGGDWVATCSCHNPDGDGVGRADFRGDTALDAVRAWQEHAARQPDDLTIPDGRHYAREVDGLPDRDGIHSTQARLIRYSEGYRVVLSIHSIGSGGSANAHVYLTDDAWNTLRGVR